MPNNFNRKCHALAATLGFTHENLREIAGVDSLRELTPQQWIQLYNYLRDEVKKVHGLTPGQKAKIYKLCYQVLKMNGSAIQKFIKRQLGFNKNVENLKRTEATKIITGLENFVRWKKKNVVSAQN